MVNIVGYMPFGVLLVLALHPAVRGMWAVAIAAVVGLLVSGTMETGAAGFQMLCRYAVGVRTTSPTFPWPPGDVQRMAWMPQRT